MAKAEPLGLAQLRDQLALLKFVRGDLAKGEACARSSLDWAQANFEDEAPITAMCQLRLGTILVGTAPQHAMHVHAFHCGKPEALAACAAYFVGIAGAPEVMCSSDST